MKKASRDSRKRTVPRRIILKAHLSPGDICTLSAAIESLHTTYPGRVINDVRTSCVELLLHNPHITKLTDAQGETIEMHYTELINCSDPVPNPFLRGYCYDLGKKLGLPLELTTNRPRLYLSSQELQVCPVPTEPGSAGGYWVLAAGVKKDFTLKQWPVEYYQEIIDHFRGRIRFVQIGADEHEHPVLDGTINLVGMTGIRELMQLVYHSLGGVGPITFLQHLCAAFEKPYMALLGGREPVIWTQYALQTTFHTIGKLPCCRTRSCWKSRVIALNDGTEQDNSLCELPVLDFERPVGKCMTIIKPSEVIRAIEACYEGGTMSYANGASAISQAPDEVRLKKPIKAESPQLKLTAHSAWGFHVKIVPAWQSRDWMDAMEQEYANRCLPMLIANQSGWFVLACHGVVAEWNGGSGAADLHIEVLDNPTVPQALSSVGSGILTWTIPYAFRTPRGWNLLCRGPANWLKDGIAPLEGLVETDWSVATFSMNWKFTRPGRCEFTAGEPVAMLVPFKRSDLETFRPRFANLSEDMELLSGYSSWVKSRQEFLAAQNRGDAETLRMSYQGHYFKGSTPAGIFFADHQRVRKLASFQEANIPEPKRSEPAADDEPRGATSKTDRSGV